MAAWRGRPRTALRFQLRKMILLIEGPMSRPPPCQCRTNFSSFLCIDAVSLLELELERGSRRVVAPAASCPAFCSLCLSRAHFAPILLRPVHGRQGEAPGCSPIRLLHSRWRCLCGGVWRLGSHPSRTGPAPMAHTQRQTGRFDGR